MIWHMHQPLYKHGVTGAYLAPWVRLHAIRDYLHMARVLADYPAVHVTFNLVPSLLEQLDEYASGVAVDAELALSRQTSWSAEQRMRLLSTFYQVNEKTVLERYPCYRRLARLKGEAEGQTDWLSDAFYRDLVAWFNLAWIDSDQISRDAALSALVDKGHGYSADDIRLLLGRQSDLIRQVIPAYRDLANIGQAELTTSPYFHPVMPLLYDLAFAGTASPGLRLPESRFSYPEDVRQQLRRAVDAHQSYFGRSPMGLWPPEGGVCQSMLSDVTELGFAWLATDENVLRRSLPGAGRDNRRHGVAPEQLYRPYRVPAGDREVTVVFRDRTLSDRIGFAYTHMDSTQAVDDFVGRLHHIAETVRSPKASHLVTVALDGENCWDYYEGNGDAFLRRLYAKLSEDPALRAVTVSEYLQLHPVKASLPELAPGGWVPNGFETWVGQPMQNAAWEVLEKARADLARREADSGRLALKTAWDHLYASEGSDWFWWYFDHNHIGGKNPYDELFRSHLRAAYQSAGLKPPERLDRSLGDGPAETAQ
jgi:alpha-amylase/alpha-mannosidase (GH57 family)